MSNTIAHRPHVHHHVPVMPVLAVIFAIVIAAVVIWAVNQPQTVTITTTGGAVATPVVQPNEVPVPRSEVVRHAQARVLLRGEPAQFYLARSLHRPVGSTSTEPLSTTPFSTAPARYEFGAFRSIR